MLQGNFMKKLSIFLFFLLCGCQNLAIPPDFVYKEIHTGNFTLASWQKIRNPQEIYKIYIEGDGYAFNARGLPSADPTPHGTLVRELAFGDNQDNVVYLARPCQYLKGGICSTRHWTTARFAPEIINAEYEAVRQIAGNHPVILIGFSGGAQVAGLISTAKSGLQVKKIITVGGNLDHTRWTTYHKVLPLNESMDLENYRQQFLQIPQHHYAGENDEVMPPHLIEDFVQNPALVTRVPEAGHNSGWEKIYSKIRAEK